MAHRPTSLLPELAGRSRRQTLDQRLSSPDQRLSSPAAARNLPPLIEALAPRLPEAGLVLELASGSGQHALSFARRFPALAWQPSDADPRALQSIAAWRDEGRASNLLAPLTLDLGAPEWWQQVPVRPSAVLAINVTHVAPWGVSEGILAGAAALLPTGAPLLLYGPFFERDLEAAPSNRSFDQSLRQQDPDWGLRLAEELDSLAAALGLLSEPRQAMAANNLLLTYRAA